MFNILVNASLRHRLFVIAAAVILIAYGSSSCRGFPSTFFPT